MYIRRVCLYILRTPCLSNTHHVIITSFVVNVWCNNFTDIEYVYHYTNTMQCKTLVVGNISHCILIKILAL